MNERIRKLAEQAGCAWWEGQAQRDMTRCQTELDKFAELIVKETMRVVANNLPSNVYLDVAEKVIEHFESE